MKTFYQEKPAHFIPNKLIKSPRVCLMYFYAKYIQYHVGVIASFSSAGDCIQKHLIMNVVICSIDDSLLSANHR